MASGLKKAELKKTYKQAKAKLATLETQLNTFCKDVETMNANIWYGGKAANKWYDATVSAYNKDVKFKKKMDTLQSKIKNKINKLDTATK